MTAFEFNEDLKDSCISLGAETAITVYFQNGVPIIPEPFYETHILFPKHFDVEKVSDVVQTVRYYLTKFEDNKFEVTDLVIECKKGVLQIIYGIFSSSKQFTKNKLKYID